MKDYALGTYNSILDVINAIEEGKWILKPKFQRNLVWSIKDKEYFLDTILNKYPFPEIYISKGELNIETVKEKKFVVDGQQRIQTIYEYYIGHLDNDLKKIPPYKSLSDIQKREFLDYKISLRDLGEISDDLLIEVFKRLNSTNYNLNKMEIKNAVYDGIFINFCKRVAENDFFERLHIFSYNDIRRMLDIEYVGILISTIMGGYYNTKNSLEKYFADYNDEFPIEKNIEENILELLAFIDKLKVTSNRISKKADFFTLFVEIYNSGIYKTTEEAKISLFSHKLNEFYLKIDSLAPEKSSHDFYNYYQAALQASTSRSNRVLRGKYIKNIIDEIFKDI